MGKITSYVITAEHTMPNIKTSLAASHLLLYMYVRQSYIPYVAFGIIYFI